jgi:hypothetical protein
VVVTCIVFWLRLAVHALMRSHRIHGPKERDEA